MADGIAYANSKSGGAVDGRLWIWAAVAITLVSVARALQLAWLSDDGFISFRYAQNLVAGHGLVYNAGEYVEGYTNLLFTLAVAAGMALGIGPEIASQLLGIACWLALVVVLARWSRRRARAAGRPWLPLAAALTLVLEDQQRWATGGLETSMFALFACAGLLQLTEAPASRARRYGAAALLALATLTRPDGVLFAALGVAYAACARREAGMARRLRDALEVAVPLALVGAALVAFKLSYYGELLPTAFYAKSALYQYYDQGLYYVALVFQRNWFVALLLPLALWCARGWLAHGLRREHGLLLVAFAGFTFYVIRSGGDFMYARRLIPALPFLWLLLEELVAHAAQPRQAVALFLLALVTAVLPRDPYGGPAARMLRGVANEWAFYPREYVAFCRTQGALLARLLEHAPVRVMYSNGLAMLAYYSRLPYLVEYSGLTRYDLARQEVTTRGRVGHEKQASKAWMSAHDIHLYLFLDPQPLVVNGARRFDYVRFGGRLTALVHIYRDAVMDALRDRPDVDMVPIEAVLGGMEATLVHQSWAEARRTLDFLEGFYLDHAAPTHAATAARLRQLVADKRPEGS